MILTRGLGRGGPLVTAGLGVRQLLEVVDGAANRYYGRGPARGRDDDDLHRDVQKQWDLLEARRTAVRDDMSGAETAVHETAELRAAATAERKRLTGLREESELLELMMLAALLEDD